MAATGGGRLHGKGVHAGAKTDWSEGTPDDQPGVWAREVTDRRGLL